MKSAISYPSRLLSEEQKEEIHILKDANTSLPGISNIFFRKHGILYSGNKIDYIAKVQAEIKEYNHMNMDKIGKMVHFLKKSNGLHDFISCIPSWSKNREFYPK